MSHCENPDRMSRGSEVEPLQERDFWDGEVTSSWLKKAESAKAVQRLVDVLEARAPYVLQGKCALVLGRLGDRRALRPLIKALAETEDAQPGHSAAEALCMLEGSEVVPAILEVLRAPITTMQVRNALRVLAEVGDTEAVMPLAALIKAEANVIGISALALDALVRVLHRHARACSSEALSAVTSVADPHVRTPLIASDGEYVADTRKTLDCSEARALANSELTRRSTARD